MILELDLSKIIEANTFWICSLNVLEIGWKWHPRSEAGHFSRFQRLIKSKLQKKNFLTNLGVILMGHLWPSVHLVLSRSYFTLTIHRALLFKKMHLMMIWRKLPIKIEHYTFQDDSLTLNNFLNLDDCLVWKNISIGLHLIGWLYKLLWKEF